MAATSLFCELPLQVAAMPFLFQTFPALKETFCAGFGKSLLPQRLSCAGAPALRAQRTQGWLCRVFAGRFTEMHLTCISFPNLWNNNDSSVWRGLVLLCWKESFHLVEEVWEGAFGLEVSSAAATSRTQGIYMNRGNKSELAIWKCDYFQKPFWHGTGGQLMGSSKCPTKDLLFHSGFGKPHKATMQSCQPGPNPLQPLPKGAWRASAAGLGHQTLTVAAPGAGQSHPKIHSCTCRCWQIQPAISASNPSRRMPQFQMLRCFTATIFLYKLLAFGDIKIPLHRT